MLKIVVCDDDKKDGAAIIHLLEEYAERTQMKYELRTFESGEQFIESGYVPHILFLDIMMDKIDGIQIGADIRKNKENIIIIYTTSLEQKMAEAFNYVHAFGYLVKPVEKDSFFQMMDDAAAQADEKVQIQTVTFLTENGTGIELSVMDIYYFEYLQRRIRIVSKEREDIWIKGRINDVAEKMKEYSFTMSHQSFVVNLYHVDKITNQSLIMKNGHEVYLAQKRVAAVRKELMQLMKAAINKGESKN